MFAFKRTEQPVELTPLIIQSNSTITNPPIDPRRTGQAGFYINKQGDSENAKKDRLNDNLIDAEERALINDKPVTRSITRSIVDNLKCFRHLQSTSAVPAFRPNRSAGQKRTPEETTRQKERLEKVTKALEAKQPRKKANKNAKYDLWQDKEKTPIGDVYVDYAEDFEKVRLSRMFKCMPKPNPQVLKKPSLLPAVDHPHPGLSYHPDKDDHSELLISIGEKKQKEINEKKKLNRKVKEGYDPTVNVALEAAKEMASGLFSEDEEEEEPESDEQADESNDKPLIIADLKRPKSNKAKRDEIKMKIDKAKSKQRKEKNKLDTEFTRIKQYVRSVRAADGKAKQKKQAKEQRKIDKLYRPARLGKERFKDAQPEFCLESELNGSLRKMTTDGNLLMDRFKSLQKRNLIEHRRVQLKTRSKPKRKKVLRSSIANKDLFERDNPDN